MLDNEIEHGALPSRVPAALAYSAGQTHGLCERAALAPLQSCSAPAVPVVCSRSCAIQSAAPDGCGLHPGTQQESRATTPSRKRLWPHRPECRAWSLLRGLADSRSAPGPPGKTHRDADSRWCPSIACMAANAASTRIWPIVESSTAFLSGCPPGGRARFRLDMEEHRSRYAQRNRITPSRGGPSRKVIPCGAPARMSRAPWTK